MKLRIIFILLIYLIMCSACIYLVDLNDESTASYSDDDFEWTVPTPSSNSRIVYVSTTYGSDEGDVYVYEDMESTDVFYPEGTINAFNTFESAYACLRDGYADYLLFRRGDTFTESIELDKWGPSGSERFVVGAFYYNPDNEAEANNSPLFETGAEKGIYSYSKGIRNIYILGLNFYANTRDPDNADYTGLEVYDDGDTGVFGSSGFGFSNSIDDYDCENITVEGCKFSYYGGNSVSLAYDCTGTITVDFRRCVILNSYTTTEGSHAQGFWGFQAQINMDECIMDHNGWQGEADSGDPGEATIFNHNTYFAGCYDSTFENCIFTRGSSMNNKWTGYPGTEDSSPNIVMNNNFYMGGEIAIQVGGNYSDYYGEYRFKDLEITNCVVQDAGWENPLGRTLGWGFYLEGMNSGSVRNNVIFFRNVDQTLTNSYGVYLKDGYSKELIIDSNIFSSNTDGPALFYADENDGEETDEIAITKNIWNATNTIDQINYLGRFYSDREYSFAGNWWFTPRTENEFLIDNSPYQKADWLLNYEPTATFGEESYLFPDESRTVETYMGEIGETESKEAFLEVIRSQDRYNWNTDISANKINNWIREGYVDS
ncbi:MAG: hypothetical protein PQJ59_11265 [Spirochaetales bacterium]|nr:hypothetical protein [Spirochaetales bacterium]